MSFFTSICRRDWRQMKGLWPRDLPSLRGLKPTTLLKILYKRLLNLFSQPWTQFIIASSTIQWSVVHHSWTHPTCPRIVMVFTQIHNYDAIPSVSPLGHPPSIPIIYTPLDICRPDTITPKGGINLKTPSTNHSHHQDFILAIRGAMATQKELDCPEQLIRLAKTYAQCSPCRL